MKFNSVAEYVPGKNLVVPDVLSRHLRMARWDPSKMDETGLGEDVQVYGDAFEECERHKTMLEWINIETRKNDTLQLVRHYIGSGWPQHLRNIAKPALDYFMERGSEQNGLLTVGNQIVIQQT